MIRRYPFQLGKAADAPFPPAELALQEPQGLLAVGGDLSPVRLLNAYAGGIFPWFSEGQPLLWWSPDPRMVFETRTFQLASRFRRSLRRSDWQVRADTAFAAVMQACANSPRPGQDGTWITAGMCEAYLELHRLGYAHSIEVFQGEELVGGIYGVAIGRMFFGESMFSRRSGGSKVALAALARQLQQWGWPLIDAQVENDHLLSLGATHLPRKHFLQTIATLTRTPETPGQWTDRFAAFPASQLG